jgi:hypothetical protein
MPTFNNIDDELAYYEALAVCQDKERRLVELCQKVHKKVMHPRDESLKALAEPLPTKWLVVAVKPLGRATVMPPEFSGHKAKKLAEFICKTENVFRADEVLYSTDWDQMLFAQQYLAGDAATHWRQHCQKHPEAL